MDRSILKGILSVGGSRVATLIIGAATTPLLYRELGDANVGAYTTLLSVFALLMIFVSSGVTDGVRKYIAEDRDDPNWEDAVVGFYFRVAIVLALVGSGTVLVLAETGLGGALFGDTFVQYAAVLAGLVVAAQFRAYTRRTLMGFGLEEYSEPLRVLDSLLFIGVGVSLVVLGHGVLGALIGHLVSGIVVGLIGLVLVGKQVSLSAVFQGTPTTIPRREMLTFNGMSIVLMALMMSLYHLDILMLQYWEPNAVVGHYKGALAIAEFLWFAPIAFQTVFVHSTSEMWSKGQTERISKLTARTTRYTLLFTGIMALGLAALAPVVVPLYLGEEFVNAVIPLILLLPGTVGFAVARPILAVAQGNGTMKFPVAATGAAAAINVALNVALIPQFGMRGAAVATSVGYGTMFLFHLWSAKKVGFDPVSEARLFRSLATIGVAAPLVLVLPSLVGNDLLSLVVVPPVGLLLFVCVACLTGALGVGEVLELLAEFPGPVGKAGDNLYWRHARLVTDGGKNVMQRSMFVAGLLLFVAAGGVVLADVGIVGDDDDGPSMPDYSNTTETPTPTPTPTPDTSNESTAGDDGDQTGTNTTDGPNDSNASTTTQTPEDGGGDDDGGIGDWFGGGDDDDDGDSDDGDSDDGDSDSDDDGQSDTPTETTTTSEPTETTTSTPNETTTTSTPTETTTTSTPTETTTTSAPTETTTTSAPTETTTSTPTETTTSTPTETTTTSEPTETTTSTPTETTTTSTPSETTTTSTSTETTESTDSTTETTETTESTETSSTDSTTDSTNSTNSTTETTDVGDLFGALLTFRSASPF
ncbi:flippase [Haloprofundus sp. MHR1]|uniref:flippase n=1 Tax=Haloprofundus sp. MHR1 TaxID=2572921 RepID=UPI0010BECDA4|nr:flippase [Haloprofundus sp. MHR1]QCJ46701.1 flippase [Haloprofundus sp. MHR1]